MTRWLTCSALTLLLSASLSSGAAAQSAAFKLQWDQPEVASVVSGYLFALKVDAAAPTPLSPTCVALAGVPGVLTRCTAPMPALPAGPHTLTVTASNGFGSASSDPLSGAAPAKPLTFTIVITVSGGE